MIPILFERNETAFNNNGIGRLRDVIDCRVIEEKNQVYECDFEYPVSGANYELIQFGRYIGVTHEESDDIQPFKIVSATRPINGIVSFHCTHISYEQKQIVVSGTNINSLADAFALLTTAQPSNRFTYEADFESSGFMAAADGVPRTVRQMLGGVRGSILDTYGGEFEWDKFKVILHQNRGEVKDYAIRYGVNLLDYNDETDYQETFTSCVAYWRGTDGEIVSATASLDESAYDGTDIRIPLDLTDKFEEKPSVSALQTEALSYMRRNRTDIPAQSIRVDFVRLAEMGEFSAFQDLLKCKLCDTIKVIFPMYGVEASFKIVRTEWDVLAGRYIGMELGTLSTTLSEALGLTDSPDAKSDQVDYIVEIGTDGDWTYVKRASGLAECWMSKTYLDAKASSRWGSTTTYFDVLDSTLTFPAGLFISVPKMSESIRSYNGRFWMVHYTDMTKDNVGTIAVVAPSQYTNGTTAVLDLHAYGEWK